MATPDPGSNGHLNGGEGLCPNCNRPIPASNLDLHYAHCVRNLEKCALCGEAVPRTKAEEHFKETHAKVTCPNCGMPLERQALAGHVENECEERPLPCEFCALEFPVSLLVEHATGCGSRTEWCRDCQRWIQLRHRAGHERDAHAGSAEDDGSRWGLPLSPRPGVQRLLHDSDEAEAPLIDLEDHEWGNHGGASRDLPGEPPAHNRGSRQEGGRMGGPAALPIVAVGVAAAAVALVAYYRSHRAPSRQP